MALSNRQSFDARAIEDLLPWHAAGALSPSEARRIDAALARDPRLSRLYADIRDECATTVSLARDLGAPPPRVLQRLLEAIDREPHCGGGQSTGQGTVSDGSLRHGIVAVAARR